MSDLISRQAAISVIAKWMLEYGGEGEERERNALKQAAEKIRELPSVDLDLSEYSDKLWKAAYERGKAEAQAERKTGRWICKMTKDHIGCNVKLYMCSACNGWSADFTYRFCPWCGARMEEQDD